MSLEIDHLVMGSILANFPTDKVEQNLSLNAKLVDDFGLVQSEIHSLGQALEKDLQKLGLPSFTDMQISRWRTVKDIVDTVSSLI